MVASLIMHSSPSKYYIWEGQVYSINFCKYSSSSKHLLYLFQVDCLNEVTVLDSFSTLLGQTRPEPRDILVTLSTLSFTAFFHFWLLMVKFYDSNGLIAESRVMCWNLFSSINRRDIYFDVPNVKNVAKWHEKK